MQPSNAATTQGATIRRVTRDWLGHKPTPEHLERLQRAVDEAVDGLESENERLAKTIQAVNDNAVGWHADDAGKARALDVIADWTSEALAGRVHPAVEAIDEARRAAV